MATHANNEQFTQGLQAFRAADYTTALFYFQQAAASGMQSDNLNYNIAVTHFKLGNYDEAAELFRRFIDKPKWRDTARYNLARIEEKRGNIVTAFESFQALAIDAKDEKIRALAMWSMNKSKLLEALYKPWDANVELGLGHDDNVGGFNKELDLNASDAEDDFFELIAQGQYLIHGSRLQGYFLTGSIYQRDYSSLNEYGSNSFSIGVSRSSFWGNWKNQLQVDFSSSEIGGDYFESRTAVKFLLKRTLDDITYRTFLRTTYHNAGSNYSRVGGWQNEWEARAEKQFNSVEVGLAYRLELNDRKDFSIDPFFISYSPTRHRLRIDSQYSFRKNWKLYGILEYIKSEYDGTNKMLINNEFVEQSRSNDSVRFSLDTEYIFDDKYRAFLRYQHYDNSDNFDIYEFNKNEFSIGVRASL